MLLRQVITKNIAKFGNLHKLLLIIASKQIDQQYKEVLTLCRNVITCELEYVNLSHPDFSNGAVELEILERAGSNQDFKLIINLVEKYFAIVSKKIQDTAIKICVSHFILPLTKQLEEVVTQKLRTLDTNWLLQQYAVDRELAMMRAATVMMQIGDMTVEEQELEMYYYEVRTTKRLTTQLLRQL